MHPDQLEGLPHPRQSGLVFGHEKPAASFLEAWNAGRLHHAWLLAGREGVGKATFAYRLASLVLSGAEGAILPDDLLHAFDHDCRDAALVATDSHPNLLVLRCSWNSKTKKFGNRITVDNVRDLQHFLGNTAGMGKWRVVIVDRADDLNVNAANALLKMLEEPPAFCLFFLVSAEPGKLPVTIRSRCRTLRMSGLNTDEMIACLKHIAKESAVELPEVDKLETIAELANGSVRLALEYMTGRTLEDLGEINKILDLLPRIDPQITIKLAERLSLRGADRDYHSFLGLLVAQISRRIREMALQGTTGKHALALWCELWETIIIRKSETDLLNLDRGNFILDLFSQIEDVANRAGGLRIQKTRAGNP